MRSERSRAAGDSHAARAQCRPPAAADAESYPLRVTRRYLSFLIVGLVAFFVSGLTMFSGFGLGTILLPTFILFFPVDVAVSATAVVHLVHNLLKAGLLFREAVPRILGRFGIPSVATAFIGALLLAGLTSRPPLLEWSLAGRAAAVTPLKLVMGSLILAFAVRELVPRLRNIRVGAKWLPLGGALAGFFGGLSGHHGAFRAAFLSELGLRPPAFVGTQAVLAIMVDVSRLLVYGAAFWAGRMGMVSTRDQWTLVGFAILAATAGVLFGWRLIRRATIPALRLIIGGLLLVVGLGLGVGLV